MYLCIYFLNIQDITSERKLFVGQLNYFFPKEVVPEGNMVGAIILSPPFRKSFFLGAFKIEKVVQRFFFPFISSVK